MEEYIEKYMGTLEDLLGVEFTEEEKSQVAQVLDKVYADGYFDGDGDAKEELRKTGKEE